MHTCHMDINKINPIFHSHDGYTFLEWEGEFYKGCKRCGGSGFYSFNGEHGRCYLCDDTSAKLGQLLGSREAAEKWCHGKAMAQARADRKRKEEAQARVDLMLAKQADLKNNDPDVFEFLMALDISEGIYNEHEELVAMNSKVEKSSFLVAMVQNLTWPAQADKPFTEKMVAAVHKIMEQRMQHTAEAAAYPAPMGRVVVTGVITSAKVQESDYGITYKILVLHDAGFKVWCSLPAAQANEARENFYENVTDVNLYGSDVWFLGDTNEPEKFTGVKGKRITFTATLQPSKDDANFAFGSRPTKGSWL